MNWTTRWRLKGLWLAHAYSFAWAHKPLCARFDRDVLRLGRVRLCRSCACVYGGMLFALAGGLAWTETVREYGHIGLCLLAVPTLALSMPWVYHRLPRRMRDGLRFTLGSVIVLSGLAVWQGHWLPGGIGLVVMLVAWRFYRRSRGIHKQHACDGCPELGSRTVCSGYAYQADLIRAYERTATDLVLNTGFVPPIGASAWFSRERKGQAG